MAQILGSYNQFRDAMSASSPQQAVGRLFKSFTGSQSAAPKQQPQSQMPFQSQALSAPTPSAPTTLAQTPTLMGGQPAAIGPPPTAQAPAPPQIQTPWLGQQPQQGQFADIFQPFQAGIQQAGEQIGERIGEFQEQVGPGQTFAGMGGADILSRALETGEGMEEAQRLLSGAYEGPSAINIGDIDYGVGQAHQLARSLGTQTGVGTLLQESGRAAGLTPGELRFEAQNLLASPEFREQASAYQRALRNLTGAQAGIQAQAADVASAREADFEKTRTEAEQFLRSRETGMDERFRQQLESARAQQQQRENLYQEFRNTGDMSKLVELEALTNPEVAGQYQEWKGQRTALDEKYRNLADVPEMVLNESGIGAKYKFKEDDWNRLVKIHGKKRANKIKAQARTRQKDLEALNQNVPGSVQAIQEKQARYTEAGQAWDKIANDPKFASIADEPTLRVAKDRYHYVDEAGKMRMLKNHPDKAKAKLLEDRQRALEEAGFGDVVHSQAHKKARGKELGASWLGSTTRGKYADIRPLYFGAETDFDTQVAPDPARFLSYQPGIAPSLGNILGQTDIEQYNRLQQLLGEAGDVVTPMADPWTAGGGLDVDVGRYLAEEQLGRGTREDVLRELSKDYFKDWRTATGERFV
jgi:hypothetical protein